jgi:hypothetical protein
MALYAAFVGVDKHRDLGIRDLAGARRDATALWALFGDTLPDDGPVSTCPARLNSSLITHHRARRSEVGEERASGSGY